jgi:NET1-associated nuclear protein 1 (U3 small nucleolar RNA-associated protein 17)
MSIQIYSAVDSLLVRRVPVQLEIIDSGSLDAARIIDTKISPSSPNFVWVACSNGQILKIDWTASGATPQQQFRTESETAVSMAVAPLELNSGTRDIIYVSEKTRKRAEIFIYDPQAKAQGQRKTVFYSKSADQEVRYLQVVVNKNKSHFLFGAVHDSLVIAIVESENVPDIEQLKCEAFTFDTSDIITCLDVQGIDRGHPTTDSKSGKAPGRLQNMKIINAIVGGARGGIYMYNDIVAKLRGNSGSSSSKSKKENIQARKFHWHRRAVYALKWARDGMLALSQ